ncbi:Cleavage stimulation factor subunit 3 [Nymphon striatum]|nr:Cleavage stimulation factor subunit 3 [Nymphon striatum]
MLMKLYCPNHEEADTRIFAHIASCDDNNVFVIQATDTDIIFLAMYHFPRLPNVVELWVEKNDLFLSIHDLVNELAKAVGKDGLALTDTLLISYILSGCDSVSYPFKRGKKRTVKVALEHVDKHPTLSNCIRHESGPSAHDQVITEARSFFCDLYGKPGYLSLDKLRAHLFASSKLDLRSLPPTEDAFHFHVLRSLCQICLYKQASLSNPVLLPPEEYGRIVDGDRLIPVMKSKPSKPSAAKLKYCKCKKKPNCLRNCPCAKAAVPCIIACACNGDREKCGRLLTDHYDDDDDDDDEEIIYTPEKLKHAESKIEDKPYDLEAWSFIIRYAQSRRIDDARPLYEKLVERFPNTGRYWKIFIDQEMKYRNYERVEKLFQRCLVKILNIELWKCYLSYVKETKGSLPSFREKMAQAYDFALDKIGMDIMSHQIWSDYIKFLKGVEAVGSYAENQRITAVRKVYQRGCQNPMINIEQLWKEYISYEQGINPILAEKMISDRSRDYMNARRVAKELETVTRGLNRNAPSIPPLGTIEESKQVELWKKYIAWEKSNPLRTEDHAMLTKRGEKMTDCFNAKNNIVFMGENNETGFEEPVPFVLHKMQPKIPACEVMFAYEQCILCLGHHPDIWYEAALFLEQSSKLLTEKGVSKLFLNSEFIYDMGTARMFSDEAAAVYERATSTLLKTNMLLYFAYSDFEEGRMKFEKTHQIYHKFLELKTVDPTLAYIQYMKFCRRAEGIKSARVVFKRAREDERCGHHVYIAAALMEYYCSKDPSVTFKIFELGLKKYGNTPEYVKAYIEYLSHLNEDNNTRVLFERVLTSGSLPDHESLFIWNKFLEFESNIGDLASVLKVEKRRAAVIEKMKEFEGKETATLVDRYKYIDLYPCTKEELKALGYMDLQGQNLLTSHGAPAIPASNRNETTAPVTGFARPDMTQMIPFKPLQDAPIGLHPVAGGVFPLPPAAVHLNTLLPKPTSFQGPFVDIEKLMDIFMKLKLPEHGTKLIENGFTKEEGISYLETAVNAANNIADGTFPRKHKMFGEGGDSSDDDENSAPPIKDIYRSRQQKRVKT